MIHEPSDPNSVPPVAESTHEQTDDELTKKEVKQMEADDQAIQTILMGLPEDIYTFVDSCDTTQEIRVRVPPVVESTHEQTDDELTKKEVKQMEADDQAIQTILMGLPEDIYTFVDSCDTTQEIRLCVEQMMKGDIDEIKEVNANCILMANLQQASTSGTQTDKAPVYDSNRSAKYNKLLKPITESYQVQQNDSNVISMDPTVEHSGEQ
nr:hypothetical protein [Tanacetum cinerariifolium]